MPRSRQITAACPWRCSLAAWREMSCSRAYNAIRSTTSTACRAKNFVDETEANPFTKEEAKAFLEAAYVPAVDRRRRRLFLSLPVGEITPTAEVRHLNAELAEEYAGHTQKMINRDLNALQDMGLVHRMRSGVQPAIDQMRAFMPLRAPENHQPG
ncbi:hypothetical protein [Streptomyces sp. RLB3-17]|uniref:hypothetical protein n=1 Tax=Streptomyces sp. RLB3-17 TaxID=2594455 RepID=UPI0013DFA86C|nr:hypothetical protein [Streptomyces sp. RLB3-17]